MKCPACGKDLKTIKAGDVELEICTDGCAGIWFDRNELLKFDEPHEFLPKILLEHSAKVDTLKLDSSHKKMCPKCENEPLVKQFIDHKNENEIEIDQCWKCAGVWMDTGEINSLRSQFKTYQDRQKEVNAYIDRQLSDLTDSMKDEVQDHIAIYNEETKNPFRAAIYAFKQLLGLDNPYEVL